MEQRLFATRRIRQELEIDSRPQVGVSAGQRLEDVFGFVGEVRQALKAIKEVEDSGGLSEQHKRLVQQVKELREQLDLYRQRITSDDPVRVIGELMQEHAEFLGLGHTDLVPTIDTRELNVLFCPLNASENRHGEFLWEIGSGANWMGYHLAALLALHEYFAKRGQENPVPNFIVIDQPSQVFFPSDTFRETVEVSTQSSGLGKPVRDRSSDLAKTHRMFDLLVRVRTRTPLDLQIIVLEHADETTWTGLENVVEKVRDWRSSGDKLIPAAWISD